MCARGNRLYGLILAGALLLAGCSGDDMPVPPATEPVAIAFDCATADYVADGDSQGGTAPTATRDWATTRAATTRGTYGHTGIINDENKELYYTGFGTFATQTLVMPDLMYNQPVAFTFLDDEPDKGYWTYSPRKYWPADLTNVALCAYAPYVAAPGADDGVTTGIIGMSDNTEPPYIEYRRCQHPEENVDLLWGFYRPTTAVLDRDTPTPARLTMRHALARAQVNITLSGTTTKKVLLWSVTLRGNVARTGRLDLTSHTLTDGNVTPTWSNQDTADDDVAIVIDHNALANPASYGILPEGCRYIDDLPARWQPEGLQKGVKTNILYMSEYPSYLYLIPQSNLTLTARVHYRLIDAGGNVTAGFKRSNGTFTVSDLRGNTTYQLNLQITIDD